VLETERLLIRKFDANDWQDLYEYLSLPEIYRFEPGEPINAEQARQLAGERSQADNFFAVVLKSGRKMIGHLYFEQIEPKEFLTWELGYIFNPAFQRQGYCTEAARRIVEYGFKDLHAHRITAFCDPANPASWKVLEKIGMQREGYFNQKAFFRRDSQGQPVWHDCLAYGILAAKGETPGGVPT
jgi:[ribosomal protein S5]-alanine N-acetyltransferase